VGRLAPLALVLVLVAEPASAAELRLVWAGGGTDRDPGTWTIHLAGGEPDARGTYSVDGGAGVSFGPGDTRVPVPGTLGPHEIAVTGPDDLALRDRRVIADDDPTAPRLTVEYAGGGTTNYPGVWMIDLFDPESPGATGTWRINDGRARPLRTGSTVVAVPYFPGTYTITVTATNNDRDHPGDEETVTFTDTRRVR
jgi:hypothetical protein